MPSVDLPIDSLGDYRTRVLAPNDLNRFGKDTLARTRAFDLAPRFERVDTGFPLVETFDVSFGGFAGDPIRGWLRLPAIGDVRATIVEFNGYHGGRGLVEEVPIWPIAGYAHLTVDTRGQGGGWRVGATADPAPGTGPERDGFLTRGILDPQDYYRRVYADCVRAVEAVRSFPRLDSDRVIVCGGSQGGGLAIATAALLPDVQAVPAAWAHAPALFSVAQMDPTCPPSTVLAAFNAYGSDDKTLVEYPYNLHDGGGVYHVSVQLAWLSERFV